jgi:diaminohydroxyphosphoribosylaminopyrimidine deaminase / 5-amino-6-(5-phosphoribosylamino)uracil reductase
MLDDTAAMRRALELAPLGRATVSPNPMVGCVLVRDGEVVGEGHHEHAGGPHAEVVALQAAGDRARGATAYVTLEPCAHQGRTGPCSAALIAAGVTRVVAAVADPNAAAAGGADRLRAAGIDVTVGVLEQEARRLNEVFFHGERTGRPFFVVKAAVSLDGRIAAADGTSQWLTGQAARRQAHELRAAADAVIVGSATVLTDDPRLTVRLDGYTGPQPLRVVLDRRGRVGADRHVCDGEAPSLLYAGELDRLPGVLWGRGVRSALVEGGAQVVAAFLRAGLADKVVVHVAPLLLGAQGRPLLDGEWAQTLAEAPRLQLHSVEQVGGDAALTLYPITEPKAA